MGIAAYEQQAMALHASLTGFPARDKISDFQVMNDVAVLYFIRAEALMHQGQNEKAIAIFQEVIKEYPYAQSWDASRGARQKVNCSAVR